MTEITFNQSPADAAVKVLIATKEEALKTYFGYDSFRPGQEAVVSALCSGRDVAAVPAVLSAAPFLISSKPLSNARTLPATKRKFWFLTP